MWVLSNYINETLNNALNSRMCAEDWLSPFAAYVRNEDSSPRKMLRSYLEVVTYLLKKYATDQAGEESDAVIWRIVQLQIMALQKYADDLIAKFFKNRRDLRHGNAQRYLLRRRQNLFLKKLTQLLCADSTSGLNGYYVSSGIFAFFPKRSGNTPNINCPNKNSAKLYLQKTYIR